MLHLQELGGSISYGPPRLRPFLHVVVALNMKIVLGAGDQTKTKEVDCGCDL